MEEHNIGCLECETIFSIEDLYGGGCPVCESSNIITFRDALATIIVHRQFIESMGLEEYDN